MLYDKRNKKMLPLKFIKRLMVQVENLKVRKKYGKQEIIDTNYIRSSTLARNRIHLSLQENK